MTVGLSGAPVVTEDFFGPREDRYGGRQTEGPRGRGDDLLNLLPGNPHGQGLAHVGVDVPSRRAAQATANLMSRAVLSPKGPSLPADAIASQPSAIFG